MNIKNNKLMTHSCNSAISSLPQRSAQFEVKQDPTQTKPIQTRLHMSCRLAQPRTYGQAIQDDLEDYELDLYPRNLRAAGIESSHLPSAYEVSVQIQYFTREGKKTNWDERNKGQNCIFIPMRRKRQERRWYLQDIRS